MASFAGVINRLLLPRTAANGQVGRRYGAERVQDLCALRAMPNEDIHLFVKKIDNTHVVRTEDKHATALCVKTILMACMASFLVVATIAPAAYGKLAGYKIERYREEQSRLKKQLAQIEAVEAQLLSPGELARIAEVQHFIDPEPEAMVVLNVDRSTALAMYQTGTKK